MILVQKRHNQTTRKSLSAPVRPLVRRESFFSSLKKKQKKNRGRLLLCPLAVRERQSDGVLLSQGRQLLEELAEDDGAVDGVLHPQRLRLLLQAGGPCD